MRREHRQRPLSLPLYFAVICVLNSKLKHKVIYLTEQHSDLHTWIVKTSHFGQIFRIPLLQSVSSSRVVTNEYFSESVCLCSQSHF